MTPLQPNRVVFTVIQGSRRRPDVTVGEVFGEFYIVGTFVPDNPLPVGVDCEYQITP
jgi:hypothetical protein